MVSLFWVAFLVGGTFVALSLVGGHGQGMDAGHGVGDAPALDLDHDGSDWSGDLAHGTSGAVSHDGVGPEAAVGWADLLSLRFAFLFSAFFGLTGLALTYGADEAPAFAALVAVLVGLVVGMGGQITLRRLGEARVSSDVTSADLVGRTGRVVVPMAGEARGTVRVVSKGSVLMLPARVVAGAESYGPGEEVVIVRMDGRTAEVVRPDRGPDEASLTAPTRVRG